MSELAVLAFGPDLRDGLVANLSRHERVAFPLETRKHAAVAVVVVDSDAERHGRDSHPASTERIDALPGVAGLGLDGSVAGTAGGPAVLLTRRAPRLRAHGGQWALPGGRLEAGESPVDAALRELHEELGLHLGVADVLGILDDYPTRSGYVITPIVVWGGADPHLDPDPGEVLSVHRISFRELCRPTRLASSPFRSRIARSCSCPSAATSFMPPPAPCCSSSGGWPSKVWPSVSRTTSSPSSPGGSGE